MADSPLRKLKRPPIKKPRRTAATRRRVSQRQILWPDVKESDLWNRAEFTGFTTIPRTLSLISAIIDQLDSKSAGRVYFDLWCRSFDDYVIEIRDEYEAALCCGYRGQRAVRTWRERVHVLDHYGFIKTHRTSHGAYRLILILDPHFVIKKLADVGLVDDELSMTLHALLVTIGELTD